MRGLDAEGFSFKSFLMSMNNSFTVILDHFVSGRELVDQQICHDIARKKLKYLNKQDSQSQEGTKLGSCL